MLDPSDPSDASSLPLPPRPSPPRSLASRAAAWIRWFGAGRLVAAACSTLAVTVGAAWLLRAAPTPVESALPVAATGGAVATAAPTLPPPPTALGVLGSPGVDTGAPPVEIVVHVAGSVLSPGVYRLPGSARAADAVNAAGGLAPDGEADALNLAAPLTDGERVYVPAIGEVDPASVPAGGVASGTLAGSASAQSAGPLDLNAATAAELEALPGVGPALAAAIVEDRQRNGPFASVEELDRVSGIGPAKLAALLDQVTV
jgi:competence protein ComEA